MVQTRFMKTNAILVLIIFLGTLFLLGGFMLWHISSNTEFSRIDPQSAPAE